MRLVQSAGYFLQHAYNLLERSGYFLATCVQVTGAQWLLSRNMRTVQVTGAQWLLSRNKRSSYWSAVFTFSQQAYKLLERSGYFIATSVQVTGAQWLDSRNKRSS